MRSAPKVIAAILACLFLTSCWLPEDFTATLNVDKGRNFQFAYDGTIVFAPVLREIKKRGKLSPADDAYMKKEEISLRKQPGFTKVEYSGRGRYRVQYQESGPLRSGRRIFFDLIEFRVDPSGRIRILGAEISPSFRKEMSAVDFKLDGKLNVTSKLAVVEHNATATPWFGGLFGAYKWHIAINQSNRPMILLQP